MSYIDDRANLNPVLIPILGTYNWTGSTELSSQMGLVRYLTLVLRLGRHAGDCAVVAVELPVEVAKLVKLIDGRDFSRGPNSAVAIVEQANKVLADLAATMAAINAATEVLS